MKKNAIVIFYLEQWRTEEVKKEVKKIVQKIDICSSNISDNWNI